MAAHRELERHTLELLKAAAARGVHLSGPYPAVEPTLRRSPALVSRVEKRAAGSTHAALVLDTLIQRTAEGILVAVRPRLSEGISCHPRRLCGVGFLAMWPAKQ